MEQLTRKGKSPEEAERIAIKEFGDAARLAASFVDVSHFKRRRWMMRFTTFAIVGSFVTAMFVMSMWPQNGPIRVASSQAQEEPATPATGKEKRDPRGVIPATTTVSRTRSTAEELAIRALASEVPKYEVEEENLDMAIQKLSQAARVPIHVSKYLEESGVDLKTPVTLKIENAKLTTILDLMLGDQIESTDWDYGVRDSLIFIASQDNFEEMMEVRVYECSDFAVPATVKSPIHAPFGGMTGAGLGGTGGFFSVPSNPRRVVPGQGNTPLQGSPHPKIVQGGNGNVRIESQKIAEAGNQMNLEVTSFKTYEIQDLAELISCLQSTVDRDSWEFTGGPATMNQVGTSLVVKQSIKNHDRIEEILRMLRRTKN